LATLEQIGEALKRADAAGNTDDARTLAQAYRAAQAQQPTSVQAAPDPPPPGAKPGSRAYADWAAQRARAGHDLPQAGPQPNKGILDKVDAAYTSALDAVPIAGPYLKGGAEELRARVQGMPKAQVEQEVAAKQRANPNASMAGTVTGAVLPFIAGGEIPGVARALGMGSGGTLLSRSLLGGGSQAAISYGDSLARGGEQAQAGESAAIGGLAGAMLPGAGHLLGRAGGALADKAGQAWNTLTRPEVAAQKVVSGAAVRDIASGKALTPTDEAAAALNGQSLTNADRFGGSVRGLARTAANSNPVARQALTDLTQDRFLTQAMRGTDFIKRVAPAIDDVTARERLQAAARASNKTAYDAAYAHPAAQVVWTPQIKALFQSPDFIKAIRGAERTGANDAATSGVKAVQSPFVFDTQGNIGLRKQADGSTALPSLQFWDIVQRNLRQASEEAYGSGRNLDGSQLAEMRRQLTGALDQAVPQFAKARAGAAAAFGADDALEAGKKFVSQKMAIPEAQRSIAALSPAEKKLFATGFASEIIDKINAAPDRVNVINQVFGSPAARKQVEMALGKPAADQLEHFVRIEDVMQMTKQAVQGNSTTAQQLIASGLIGGGVGGALGGWDPRNVMSGAALAGLGRAGMRAMGKAFDQRVMQRVADILASQDPKEINRQILNATLSPKHADAIKAIQAGLHAAVRGALTGGASAPLAITIHGGAQ
jgi:hypothetical protein